MASDRFSEVVSELSQRHGASVAEAKHKYKEAVGAMKAMCSFCGERSDPKVRHDRATSSRLLFIQQLMASRCRMSVSCVIVQGGDALLEALSSLFTQITREPPLPAVDVSSSMNHIKEEIALEQLREEKAMKAIAKEVEVEAALEQQMSRTLSQIEAFRRGSTT